MNKWQIEKLLGHNIPFLERSLNKKHLEKTDIIHSNNCCSIILNSYNLNFETTNPIFTIFVNFKNSFFTSRTQVFTEKISDNSFASSIYFYNNDCDNIMHINIVIQDENKFYFFSGDIMLCKVMQEDKEFDKYIKMYEDMYFMKEKLMMKGDKWIEIGYNVFSTKSDNDIHLYDTIDELDHVNDKNGCKVQNNGNENVILGVDCQKTIKVEYNSRTYEIGSNKCIFCCREYKTMFNLQKHIFLSHLYHKTLVNSGKLTIIEKTEDELANTYLSGFAYLEKTVLKMIGSKKQNLEYRRVSLIFIRTSYKRKLTTKKYKMKMKRYVNEIMIDVKDYVLDDWMIAQKKQQLKEFVDIEPDKLVMMNLWNGFVFKKGNSINKYNIHAKLVEFLRQMPRSKDMLDILTMMYQKKIITQQDIHEIIDEATKT